jgi:hypothetical protein
MSLRGIHLPIGTDRTYEECHDVVQVTVVELEWDVVQPRGCIMQSGVSMDEPL